MFGRYSERARRVIILAQDEARRLDHKSVGTEHLLLGLIREGTGIAAKALQSLGVDLESVRTEVERRVGRGSAPPPEHEMQFTSRGKRVVMELAIEEARSLGHPYVGTEHILLGILRDPECGAARLLKDTGMESERLRGDVAKLLGSPPPPAVTGRAEGPGSGGAPPESRWTDPEGDVAARARAVRDAVRARARLEGGSSERAPTLTRYSERAQRVIILAQEEARRLNYKYVGTEHLLLGLIREGSGIAGKALQNLGVNLDQVRSEIERMLGRGAAPPVGDIQFTPRGKNVVMELAIEESMGLGHSYVGTEHLLLGLIREGECAAARLLENMGADLERVRREVIKLLGTPVQPGLGEGSRFVRWVLRSAEDEARRLNHPHVGPEHLLLGLVRDPAGTAAQVLQGLGIDLDRLRGEIEHTIGHGTQPREGAIPLTPEARMVVDELAGDEARRSGRVPVRPEHVRLGILREGRNAAAPLLEGMGADLERVRREVTQMERPETAALLRASAVVFDAEGRVLLAGQAREGGRWSLPGSAPGLGESLREAAARAVREATGVEVACGRLLWALESLGGPGGSLRLLEFVYLAEERGSGAVPGGPPSGRFAHGEVPAGAALPPGFWQAADAGFAGHDPGASRRVPPPD